jgi:tRNA(adenine34) deaminase
VNDDVRFMMEALREARKAAEAGEVPVGAVVVHDGRVIGRGHNRVEALRDATAHAEILAIGAASEAMGSWRLSGTTLYCTLEPCPMCAGALLSARVSRLVFGARDPKFGAVRSLTRLLDEERFNHHVAVAEGVAADESLDLLRRFFRMKRERGAD